MEKHRLPFGKSSAYPVTPELLTETLIIAPVISIAESMFSRKQSRMS